MDARISGDLVIGTSAANTNCASRTATTASAAATTCCGGDGGTDVCIGGPRTDTFDASCETQIE